MSALRKKKILEEVKRGRRRRTLATTAVVALLATVVIVAIILLSPRTPQGNVVGAPISTALYNDLSGVSYSTLSSVGGGQGASPLTPVSGTLLTSDGRPEVLYVGAEYCPYCASERWSMIVALSKFGSFNGLTYMLSADSPEPFPNTATFSFGTVSYTSGYVSFVSVETQHRDRSPFQILTGDEQSIMNTYDSSGGVPFVDVANKYVGSYEYSPGLLSGLNWTQVGSQLEDPNSAVAKAVDGAANYLITAICKVDGGNPSSICGQSFAGLTQAPLATNNMPLPDGLSAIVTGAEDVSWRNFLRPTWQ